MKIYRIVLLIAAGLLCIASITAASLPYDFFMFLRVVVCGVAVYTAYRSFNTVQLFLGSLVVAILFNPFSIVHLPQPVWRLFDLVVAAMFVRLALKSAKMPS